ncbi:MAG: PD-(D/E)XK nuclease family protein [Oscillospiraceae bacterium]
MNAHERSRGGAGPPCRQAVYDPGRSGRGARFGPAVLLAGPLAAEILSCPNVHREFRFVLELPPAALGAQVSETVEDRVTVQGVADCILEYPDRLAVIDFKTDRIFDPGALRERYAPQLALYRQAAEISFGKPVARLALYSFALGREVELPV